jgi:hypothetical protein
MFIKTGRQRSVLVFLLGVLLAHVSGPLNAEECKNSPFAGTAQARCPTQRSERRIADTTLSGGLAQIAVFPGPPKDGVGCNRSLTIGDNIGWYGNGTPGTITDINVIEQKFSESTVFNQHVSYVVTAGWLYLDERGNYWVQINRRALSPIASRTRAFFASLGLDGSEGISVATTGRHPPDVRSAHLQVQRCWANGKLFVSAG